ncbi:MAG: hypothetical protein IPJ77_20440 [Planctomycetes bacterium]|nr:hypothetical protein [Planctomycetota bacterium]
MTVRPWIVAGLVLVLVGFAFTLAFDLFRTEPEVLSVAPEPPTPRVELDAPREAALERDARSNAPTNAGTRRDAPTATAAPSRAREQIRHHPDGAVRDRVALDDSGQPHGPYASFHQDGSPWETGTYEHGRKHGAWRAFHENGAVREETQWESGVQRGLLRQWDQEGHLLREAQVDGQLEGRCTTWYPSGQLESRGRYSAGRREGRWEFWGPSGEIDSARTGTYVSDQRTDG